MLDFLNLNNFSISDIMMRCYDIFGAAFGSPWEMGLYVCCLMILNMIALHLFFGPRFQGSMARKVLLSALLVGELILFTQADNLDQYSSVMNAPIAHLNLN